MNENQVAVIGDKLASNEPLDYQDIRKNAELVKELVKKVLIKDIDYGTIPGCGDKKCLFKPGAEKIALMFKIGAFPTVQDMSEVDVIKYVVKTSIIHIPTGRELGVGLGAASTDEEKYKWRKAVCKEEFESTDERYRRVKWFRGKYDIKTRSYGTNYTVEQVRTNPADQNNTILKMAKKRSFLDAVISTTAASDLLTQDLEESEPQERQTSRPTAKPSETKDGFVIIKAKYESMCKGCEGQIEKGTSMAYSKDKGVYHPDCVK